MKRLPLVTVVVPTYNRACQLIVALRSILAQSYRELEIVVVDDCSTDDTREAVNSFGESRIRYIRHSKRRNGAAARNTGIRNARGDYVAFLDSDDRWLPDHLIRKIQLLQETGAKGVFGSFNLAWTDTTTAFRCIPKPDGMPMAEYILSSFPGDARTSTFVFEKPALRKVMFDASLEKHQDWDLAIRFADEFPFACDRESMVIIHPDSEGRMSHRMKHAATREFLDRYEASLSPATRAGVYARLAMRTIQIEGRNSCSSEYIRQAAIGWRAAEARDKIIIAALSVPVLDRAFLWFGTRFMEFRRRSQRHRSAETEKSPDSGDERGRLVQDEPHCREIDGNAS